MKSGMTLLELVLVTAIVATLVALAVPTYRHYLLRVNRVEAARELLSIAACQERLKAVVGAYDTGACPPRVGMDAYTIRYGVAQDESGFVVTANPVGNQEGDACGTLTLDHRGLKQAEAGETEAGNCWAGR